jgi:hypothetical protein
MQVAAAIGAVVAARVFDLAVVSTAAHAPSCRARPPGKSSWEQP